MKNAYWRLALAIFMPVVSLQPSDFVVYRNLAPATSFVSEEKEVRFKAIEAALEQADQEAKPLTETLFSNLLDYFTYLTMMEIAYRDPEIREMFEDFDQVSAEGFNTFNKRSFVMGDIRELLQERYQFNLNDLPNKGRAAYRDRVYLKDRGLSSDEKKFAEKFVVSRSPIDNLIFFLKSFEAVSPLPVRERLHQHLALRKALAELICRTTFEEEAAAEIPWQVETIFWNACENLSLPFPELEPIPIESHFERPISLRGDTYARFGDQKIHLFKRSSCLWVHLVCALLDEYLQQTCGTIRHIPRVLGVQGPFYTYQFAEGTEMMEEYPEEYNGRTKYWINPVGEKTALDFFNAFFRFHHDFSDPESGGMKNFILNVSRRGLKPIEDESPSPRTWQLIDFESRSSEYQEKLPLFLAQHAAALKRVLGKERFDLLGLASRNLVNLTPNYRKFRFAKLFRRYQEEMIAESLEEEALKPVKILVRGAEETGVAFTEALTALGFDVTVWDADLEKARACAKRFNCYATNGVLNEAASDSSFHLVIDTQQVPYSESTLKDLLESLGKPNSRLLKRLLKRPATPRNPMDLLVVQAFETAI